MVSAVSFALRKMRPLIVLTKKLCLSLDMTKKKKKSRRRRRRRKKEREGYLKV
jgi:hypothetical protein